jgi:hypothetical protein
MSHHVSALTTGSVRRVSVAGMLVVVLVKEESLDEESLL